MYSIIWCIVSGVARESDGKESGAVSHLFSRECLPNLLRQLENSALRKVDFKNSKRFFAKNASKICQKFLPKKRDGVKCRIV